MVKIEVLQYFKSRERFGKFSQTYLLKVGAKSLESRGEVDHKPLRAGYLICRGRQVQSLVNDVMFDFLCEDKEGVSG